ncbi:hypothetical protein BKA63DRAFT_555259 [Paraphoma chrysanthemicola]|nr:hypothetical protein BKA63DRAFT_555259 [Paraphoma chrysanthemicola]
MHHESLIVCSGSNPLAIFPSNLPHKYLFTAAILDQILLRSSRTTQNQHEDGILAGELLWKKTLKCFYRHTESQYRGLYLEDSNDAYTDEEDLESYTDSEDGSANGPFRFLDLPPETRLNVYAFVLLHEGVERKERKRDADFREHISKHQNVSQSRPTYRSMRPSLWNSVDPSPRVYHVRLKSRIEEQHDANELIPGAEASYRQCKAEYEIRRRGGGRRQPEQQGLVQYHPPVHINARGNLCDDLPMLALTCCLVLSEMWNRIYPSKPDPLTRYKATIRNLNFFPLFRFPQMLNRSPNVIHVIDPTTIDIRFDTKNRSKDNLHRNTFKHVKRLIELHWLRDFPLWNCITGLSTQPHAPQNPFTDYMYRIRQIIKLYHIDRLTWKSLTATCIHRADVVEQDKIISETYWLTQSDSIIVEAAIETLAKAVDYKLGYEGNWSPVGRDGSEWHEKHMRMFMYRGKRKRWRMSRSMRLCHAHTVAIHDILHLRQAFFEIVANHTSAMGTPSFLDSRHPCVVYFAIVAQRYGIMKEQVPLEDEACSISKCVSPVVNIGESVEQLHCATTRAPYTP